MARVSVPVTSLPAGSVDGADGAVTLTTCDAANDHIISYPQAGDLVCVWATGTTANVTTLQAYPNKYGRPSVAAPELSDAGSTAVAGRLVVYYVTDLDGLVNATGGLEFNVSQAYRCFAIRGGGKA